ARNGRLRSGGSHQVHAERTESGPADVDLRRKTGRPAAMPGTRYLRVPHEASQTVRTADGVDPESPGIAFEQRGFKQAVSRRAYGNPVRCEFANSAGGGQCRQPT